MLRPRFVFAGCALQGCTAGRKAVALWVFGSGTGALEAGGSAHLRGATTCPGDGLGTAGAVCFAPEGVWISLQYWRADWPLGSSLVPLRDPQAWATLSSPARRAQGGLLDGAPEAPKGPGGQFSARADDMIIHMRCFGTRQASAKPLPATTPPPPFRTRPCPTDACLRAVLQVWLSTIFRRA